jgi:hypothetical protein
MFAASDGRTMNPRGTFDRLRRNERPIGVRVSEVHRDRTLDRLRLGLRTWQKATKAWAEAGIAHRCRDERVFLLLETPANDACPDCRTNLWFVGERTASSPRTNREFAEQPENGEPLYGNPVGGNLAVERPVITPEEARRLLLEAQRSESEIAALSDEEALRNVKTILGAREESA